MRMDADVVVDRMGLSLRRKDRLVEVSYPVTIVSGARATRS
jgi:hypothetical protein